MRLGKLQDIYAVDSHAQDILIGIKLLKKINWRSILVHHELRFHKNFCQLLIQHNR